MPLTVEITGEEHPKKVTLISDDENALNATLIEKLQEEGFEDLAEVAKDAPFENGQLRVEVPPEDVGEIIDWAEFCFTGSPAANDLQKLRADAEAEAMAALGGDEDEEDAEDDE